MRHPWIHLAKLITESRRAFFFCDEPPYKKQEKREQVFREELRKSQATSKSGCDRSPLPSSNMQELDRQDAPADQSQPGPSHNNTQIAPTVPEDSPSSNSFTAPALNPAQTFRSVESRRTFNPVPRRPTQQQLFDEHEPWRPKNVLALDGGGVRGYYSLLILKLLMTMVKICEQSFTNGNGVESPADSSFWPHNQPLHVSHTGLSGDSEQASRSYYLPCHYFDTISGTSTGGLIAIMLSRLRMTVEDCITEYVNLGGKIFGKPRHLHELIRPLYWIKRTKYDAKKFVVVINDVTQRRGKRGGGSRFESDADLCRTLTFALKGVENKAKMSFETLFVFRSYPHLNGHRGSVYPRNPGEASPYDIWEIARATSAAPFYFDPMLLPLDGSRQHRQQPHQTFIDAGFSPVNNPAEEAYHEVTTSNQPIGTFVSVGTARRMPFRSGRGFGSRVKGGLDALGDTEDVHTRMISEANSAERGFSYFRFNEPNALSDVDMDEWIPRSSGARTLEKMDTKFNAWAMQPDIQADFQRCALELVRRRRLRAAADPSRWERFALGSHFVCPEDECEEGRNSTWSGRAEFGAHLINVHDADPDPAKIKTIADSCRTDWTYKSP